MVIKYPETLPGYIAYRRFRSTLPITDTRLLRFVHGCRESLSVNCDLVLHGVCFYNKYDALLDLNLMTSYEKF